MGGDERYARVEMRVHGLQRSGNHAIVNWIAMQSRGTCVYLNDARPGTNPFESLNEYLEYHNGEMTSLTYAWDVVTRRNVRADAPSTCDLLIHSYEDTPITRRSHATRKGWLAEPERFHDILIVRDPLNFFASRLLKWKKLTGIQDVVTLVELWKAHVREALGETSQLSRADKVVIDFGRWKGDIGYRKQTAADLRLDFSDRGIDRMVRVGEGSSFDQFKYENNASAMKTNERWKTLARDARYLAILADEELQGLSVRLFGQQDAWQDVLGRTGLHSDGRADLHERPRRGC